MGLIRFLIIAIAILYILRFIARLLLPALFQSFVNKAQQQHGGQSHQQERRPVGKIQVDYMPPKKESPLDKEGEFVDYEEVK